MLQAVPNRGSAHENSAEKCLVGTSGVTSIHENSGSVVSLFVVVDVPRFQVFTCRIISRSGRPGCLPCSTVNKSLAFPTVNNVLHSSSVRATREEDCGHWKELLGACQGAR